MDDRALPLDEHQIGIHRTLEHEPLGSAGDEVGNHGVHANAAPLDQDARLPGGGKVGTYSAAAEATEQLQLRRHLADVAVGADGQHHGGVDLAHSPASYLEIPRRPTQVMDRDAVLVRQGSQLGDVADEAVQAAPDLELALDRAGEQRDPLAR